MIIDMLSWCEVKGGTNTMSMKRRPKARQKTFWITCDSLASSPGHPFYDHLERLLQEAGFDAYVERRCASYYAAGQGRPSIPPGVYFRMLLIGYFERIDSERGICWRCADSLSLRGFLGLGMEESTPDHSSLSRIRTRLSLEVHQEVFGWVLGVLGRHGLVDGKTLGVDATTLEANAALRSIVRRDTGERYESFLIGLAQSSGIPTPTRADLARVDRKRPKKGSNQDWKHPHDPDAAITKMKDGSTHLGHKLEHAVDMSGEGAVLSVTLHGGSRGDTQSLPDTLREAQDYLGDLACDPEVCESLHPDAGRELVADKGYHSNDTLLDLAEEEYRTYISEPERGRRRWEGREAAQRVTYANRQRIRGERGKRLLRQRGELLERPFAHYLEAGGMRRTHLRRHTNILKRLLVHVAGFNLGILMRHLVGTATPRAYAALYACLSVVLFRLRRALRVQFGRLWTIFRNHGRISQTNRPVTGFIGKPLAICENTTFSTGC
jgi:transposase